MSLQLEVKNILASWPHFQSGESVLAATADGQEVRCELTALDSMACAFQSLLLHSSALAGRSAEQLKGVAEKLSARLTYLLEPISPIEIDAQGCLVQMRSNPPQKGEDGTTYYELLVARSGELSLRRFNAAQRGQRTAIAAQVTREVLLRLVGDFSAVAR